ncbi:MAG: hypothetical protein AAGF88_11385 [Pseudomonadota bacterium]
MKRPLILSLFALTVAAAPAAAEPLVAVNTDVGQVLAASESGLTLYTFSQDGRNQSNCYDSCASAWPPFLAADDATPQGGLGIIERNDGSRQWALNGQPLYFWQGDAEIGDTTGHGVGGVWFVALNGS